MLSSNIDYTLEKLRMKCTPGEQFNLEMKKLTKCSHLEYVFLVGEFKGKNSKILPLIKVEINRLLCSNISEWHSCNNVNFIEFWHGNHFLLSNSYMCLASFMLTYLWKWAQDVINAHCLRNLSNQSPKTCHSFCPGIPNPHTSNRGKRMQKSTVQVNDLKTIFIQSPILLSFKKRELF